MGVIDDYYGGYENLHMHGYDYEAAFESANFGGGGFGGYGSDGYGSDGYDPTSGPFYGSDGYGSDGYDAYEEEVSFRRPDGRVEGKTVGWCRDTGAVEIRPGLWALPEKRAASQSKKRARDRGEPSMTAEELDAESSRIARELEERGPTSKPTDGGGKRQKVQANLLPEPESARRCEVCQKVLKTAAGKEEHKRVKHPHASVAVPPPPAPAPPPPAPAPAAAAQVAAVLAQARDAAREGASPDVEPYVFTY